MVSTSGKDGRPATLSKAPTGIRGFDDITHGGLPRGRATLVTGAAGSGKSLFGVEFLVRGAQAGEPGVLLTCEETTEDIVANAASLGFDLEALQADGTLAIDSVVGEADDAIGDRRVRPRRAVHQAGTRDRLGLRPARRARHHRGAVRRTARRGDRTT